MPGLHTEMVRPIDLLHKLPRDGDQPPGQDWFETLEVVLLELLWPITGVSRALAAIYNHL
jgi:hypothetical protein